MSQQEIFSLLKRFKNKWFSINELRNKFNITKGSIQNNLQRMAKHNEVEMRRVSYNPKFRKLFKIAEVNV